MSEPRSVPSVLITGASTGIGQACALRLDHAGYHVFAGVRRPADAEAAAPDAGDASFDAPSEGG